MTMTTPTIMPSAEAITASRLRACETIIEKGMSTFVNVEAITASRLRACETIIEKGMSTFVNVGRALAEIRDSELYKVEHGTFEAYCKERWGFSRPRAYQLIEAAGVVDSLSNMLDKKPSNPRQACELAKAPVEKRAEVWAAASADGEPTAAKVKAAVEKHTGYQPRSTAYAKANAAIDHLMQIPVNDPERKLGFQVVRDWLDGNEAPAAKKRTVALPAGVSKLRIKGAIYCINELEERLRECGVLPTAVAPLMTSLRALIGDRDATAA